MVDDWITTNVTKTQPGSHTLTKGVAEMMNELAIVEARREALGELMEQIRKEHDDG